MQRCRNGSAYRCTHTAGECLRAHVCHIDKTNTGVHKHAREYKDNHARQEEFWMDGAERHRRCKEWFDVNNLEVAVQWT